jgi:hypothetical protein
MPPPYPTLPSSHRRQRHVLRVALSIVAPPTNYTTAPKRTMPQGPGPILRAWYEWRMKRFPWRKKWLVGSWLPQLRFSAYPGTAALTPPTGFDLQGNTFWEFKDQLHALRNRRIAKYSRKTQYSDVDISRAYLGPWRPTLADMSQRHGYNGSAILALNLPP